MIDNWENGLDQCTVQHSWGTIQHKKFEEDTACHPFLCYPSRSIEGASQVF